MARIKAGTAVSELSLPNIDGSQFSIEEVKGRRYLLSFFRFASCPFCNLRVHELVTHYSQYPENFTIVGIFDSPLDNLQKHAAGHDAPFPILADAENRYYQKFGVERSIAGVLRGMFLRMHRAIYGMFVKGYIPLSIKGAMTTMPLNILVDEQGIVQYAHYGRDEGDHLPLLAVKEFADTGSVPAGG